MIESLKELNKNAELKKLFGNYLSLFSLQGINYLLLIVTLPYLVRVLGPEKYGLISFAMAITVYMQIVTDFGFNLTATRDVSVNRGDNNRISVIYGSVFVIKAALVIICFIVFFLVSVFVNRIKVEWLFYLMWYGVVIGNALMPIWLFQGLESMRYVAKVNIMVKLIFSFLIFVFVRKSSDYILVPVLNSVGYVSVGLWSLYLVKKDFKIRMIIPKFNDIKHYFFDGLYVFVSNVSVSMYTASSVIILGIMTNNTFVGYYAAGEKVIQAVLGVMTPFYRAIYPYNARKINESVEEGLRNIRIMARIVGVLMFVIGVLLYLLSEKIVLIVLGPDYYNSVRVVKILSFVPLLSGLANVFGVQTMLNVNMKKTFTLIMVLLSMINIPVSIALVHSFNYIGSAFSLLVIEALGVALMVGVLIKRKCNVL